MAKFLSMDLGTCNTCVCGLDGTRLDIVKVSGVSERNGSIPTTILYKNKKPYLIGKTAEAEFNIDQNNAPESGYDLRTQFKPDISENAAYRWMVDFLTMLRQAVPQEIFQNLSGFYVGVPCDVNHHYKSRLKQCFADAEWIVPELIEEPIGALINFVHSRSLTVGNASRDVLVVDFGGGTCDFSVVNGAKVSFGIGDGLLGGRLFDDIFYQIFLEQNPQLESELMSDDCAYFVHWIYCRREKERFSDAIRQDINARLNLRVSWQSKDGSPKSAYVKNLGWEDFVERARNYKMSGSMSEMMSVHKNRPDARAEVIELLNGGKCDVLSWFESVARQVAPKASEDMCALLTGGSSSWLFVSDSVSSNFKTTPMISEHPHADIAMGLALYKKISDDFAESEKIIKRDMPNFLNDIRRVIEESLVTGKERFCSVCAESFVKLMLKPQLEHYTGGGGNISVNELEEGMKAKLDASKHVIEEIVRREVSLQSRNVAGRVESSTKEWLADRGVKSLPKVDIDMSDIDAETGTLMTKSITDLISKSLRTIILKVALPAIALIALYTGPLGAAICAAIALITSLSDYPVKFAKKIPFPSKFLTNERIEKICQKATTEAAKNFSSAFGNSMSDYVERAKKLMEKQILSEIKSLSVLNQIKTE